MPTTEQTALLDRVTALAERAAQAAGVEIVEVQVKGGGKARLLRVYIDKAGGVAHGDCELMSDKFGALLDEDDPIPGDSYTLEVSSPGVERKLSKPRDFERVLGQKIRVSLREPIGGQKSFEGKLVSVVGEAVTLETVPGEQTTIPLAQVAKANVKFDW